MQENKYKGFNMKTLFERVFAGNDEMYNNAIKAVDEAVAKLGSDAPIVLDTAYSKLPCYYAMTGNKVETLGEAKNALETTIKGYMTRNKRTKDIFTSGVATAMSAEIIEAMKYTMAGENGNPYEGTNHMGHFTDAQIRTLGVPLVTKDIPGVAVIIGKAPDEKQALELIKSYQSQGIFVTMVGEVVDQVVGLGQKLGFDLRCVGLGDNISAVAHAVSVTLRTAIIFGNVTPGDYEGMWQYTMARMYAFVNAYAPVDDVTVACGAGAIQLGFPVITDDTEENNMFRIPKSLIIQTNRDEWNATSLEARDIKIKITKIDIPVAFSNSFEGEIVRKGDMQIEFDGSNAALTGCELVLSKDASQIEDHKITLIGKDIDEYDVGSKLDIAIIAEVGGKNMQEDFEGVFERKFHQYINCIEGVMHTGQRDILRIRINKTAFEQGFRIKHIGEVLYAKLMSDYDNVIDKCQVTIYTDKDEAKRVHDEIAEPTYNKRDDRLGSMTDESVDQFYTCILCQAFSPTHVCIVTPERLGLCGAVSWLDAKANNELDPNGPCQIVKKDHILDEKVGRIQEVYDAVKEYSHGALEKVTLYSIMEDPMTSCGCFECICGIEPMTNGVIIVNREYSGMTPLGMTFSEMASMTGGGAQTPGFMGHGKHFIASKKFMKAEGGLGRIVWMPKDLKDQVASKLNASAKELYDIDNFVDMIADDTITSEDPEALLNFISEKGHPVLSMEPLM